jgi:hypothetical protein
MIYFPSQHEILDCLKNQSFCDLKALDDSIKSLAAVTFANQAMTEGEFKDKMAIVLYESIPVDLISVRDYMTIYDVVLKSLQGCGSQVCAI